MSSFGVYRLTEVDVIFGVIAIKDSPADGFITIAYDANDFEEIQGADGSVTRYATENTMATVTINLKRGSNENPKLSAVRNADVLAPGGAGVAPLTIKDKQGSSLFFAEQAWIQKMPDSGHSKDVGPDIAWPIRARVRKGAHIIGGNQIV